MQEIICSYNSLHIICKQMTGFRYRYRKYIFNKLKGKWICISSDFSFFFLFNILNLIFFFLYKLLQYFSTSNFAKDKILWLPQYFFQGFNSQILPCLQQVGGRQLGSIKHILHGSVKVRKWADAYTTPAMITHRCGYICPVYQYNEQAQEVIFSYNSLHVIDGQLTDFMV